MFRVLCLTFFSICILWLLFQRLGFGADRGGELARMVVVVVVAVMVVVVVAASVEQNT